VPGFKGGVVEPGCERCGVRERCLRRDGLYYIIKLKPES
jgi:hypothetical protein